MTRGTFLPLLRRRVRRPGFLVLVIGLVATAYVIPPFYRSMVGAWGTNKSSFAMWPPDMIRQFQSDIDEAYREFYTWMIFLILALLFLIAGIYLTLKPDRKRAPPGRRSVR